MSHRSVLDDVDKSAYASSLHRPMMPAGRAAGPPSPATSTNSLTFVNLGSASALFSQPASSSFSMGAVPMGPPGSGGGIATPPHSSGGPPMSGGVMPPLMPAMAHGHPQQMPYAYPPSGYPPQQHVGQMPPSPMSWGMPPMHTLPSPLQPNVHHPLQPHHAGPHMGPPPAGVMQPQAPFSMGGPGSQGHPPHMLPNPLQPTHPGRPGSAPGSVGQPGMGWSPQQHMLYGQQPLHGYPSPPGSLGSNQMSTHSMPPASLASSPSHAPSLATGPSLASMSPYGPGSEASSRIEEAQRLERERQRQEQLKEERLREQQRQVKLLQEEQQRHLREEQERERIEMEKRRAERERMRLDEERKRQELVREQERQQEAMRLEQMRIFEELQQAQRRLQQENELKQQKQQLEQQQQILKQQQIQAEQLRQERLRLEEERRREEEAARLKQEMIKQEEERKRQELLRQELQRQEQFAKEQRLREEALAEKRRQEQLLIEQQERLRLEQARAEHEQREAARLEIEARLAEEVRRQQEKLRQAQEEIQREKERMALDLMREQQRIQEERQRLHMEQERLKQERIERERLEEEHRRQLEERARQQQEQLLRQQEAIRMQHQAQMEYLRQQQEFLKMHQSATQLNSEKSSITPGSGPAPTQPQMPGPSSTEFWSPFGSAPDESAQQRPRASTGGTPSRRTSGPHDIRPDPSPTADKRVGSAIYAHPSTSIHFTPTRSESARLQRKPKRSLPPAPIKLPLSADDQESASKPTQTAASFEAYAAEVARKHMVMDRSEIMTANAMFDSSAFEEQLDQFTDGDDPHARSSYYDDSSDDERSINNVTNKNRTTLFGRSKTVTMGSTNRPLASHKTGPAATKSTTSIAPPSRVHKPISALRTGPAGAPSDWDGDATVKAKDSRSMSDASLDEADINGNTPQVHTNDNSSRQGRAHLELPIAQNRRRSTGSANSDEEDDDEPNAESNGATKGKEKGRTIKALVKHSTGALKRSPRPPAMEESRAKEAEGTNMTSSVDSMHPSGLIDELKELSMRREGEAPRSAPVPRALRPLPAPQHTSPPPSTTPRSHTKTLPLLPEHHLKEGTKSLPPLPVGSPPPIVRQSPQKKGSLPPVPRKVLTPQEAACLLQSRWRGVRARRAFSQIALRTKVAKEIYSSELVYVQSLGVTIDVFLKPLRKAAEQSKPIILSADITSIFGTLEDIYAYHLQLVSKLEARVSKWNITTKIGDTFLDMKQDFITLYSSYINHYDQALATLARCRELKSFKTFIQRCNQHPECGGLSLESFLILPVQRVTRYVILLRDLSKKTPEDHVDYHNINAAQTYMDNICYQVNENKRSAENLKKQMDTLASLQAKMKPKDTVRDLVDQNRVFVKQMVLTLYDQDSDKRREICLFVFNDMLLVTKGDLKKDRYTITAKFTREDNLRLEVMADTDDFMGQQIKNAFVLHSPRVSYLFFCASAEERNSLCDHIRVAITVRS